MTSRISWKDIKWSDPDGGTITTRNDSHISLSKKITTITGMAWACIVRVVRSNRFMGTGRKRREGIFRSKHGPCFSLWRDYGIVSQRPYSNR